MKKFASGQSRRVGKGEGPGKTPFRASRGALLLGLGVLLFGLSGCVTEGDFRKLEERVLDESQRSDKRPNPSKQIAQLSAQIDALRDEQRKLSGELEVTRKQADRALEEARKARRQLASQSANPLANGAQDPDEGKSAEAPAPEEGARVSSEELAAYQKSLDAWRGDDQKLCIDRFRKFLQTYPASPHADDAAYWLADCHFKQGDYRVAVLRFNDVVQVYPTGNKAPEALYRQGESLLKLGPGFHDAARTVFEQVVKDYPDSALAKEAKKQLSALGSG
ncbi:MAG: tol-pal system protein YbgF [Myxococcota bacterium]|jgi:tol-pal system protein YbgF|nr:tol-pal system protein YbgF [Myxococcota bacterium]